MTTIQVRSHERRKPDRIKNDPFRDLIEARLAARRARAERFEASQPVRWKSFREGFVYVWGHPISLAAILVTGTAIIMLNHYGAF